MFKTPRLLLEVRHNGWKPVKIYCTYPSLRAMLSALPRIAEQYGGVDNTRIKYLATHDQIAAAKLSIYQAGD